MNIRVFNLRLSEEQHTTLFENADRVGLSAQKFLQKKLVESGAIPFVDFPTKRPGRKRKLQRQAQQPIPPGRFPSR